MSSSARRAALYQARSLSVGVIARYLRIRVRSTPELLIDLSIGFTFCFAIFSTVHLDWVAESGVSHCNGADAVHQDDAAMLLSKGLAPLGS